MLKWALQRNLATADVRGQSPGGQWLPPPQPARGGSRTRASAAGAELPGVSAGRPSCHLLGVRKRPGCGQPLGPVAGGRPSGRHCDTDRGAGGCGHGHIAELTSSTGKGPPRRLLRFSLWAQSGFARQPAPSDGDGPGLSGHLRRDPGRWGPLLFIRPAAAV